MAHYKVQTKINSDDSEYESDGETTYSPVKSIGEGAYAKARLFKSKSKKSVVVLNPVVIPGDIEEAKIKQRFFQTIYPDKKSPLFPMEETKDYRLIVPYVPYSAYEELTVDEPEFQRILFRSALHVLKDCHDKGIIVVDLKPDNIYYDLSTQKSYLIDGGLSAPIGTPIDPLAFQKPSQLIVEEYKKEYEHIPPECWSVKPNVVLATPEIDIYSLGILMSDVLKNPDSDMQLLIDSCLKKDPKERPTLEKINDALTNKHLIYGGFT